MNPASTKDCKNGELASYQDAVWSYLLEHCDLTTDGALFVKFHTSDRATFEKRIRARWKYGYHRGDPVARNQTHLEKKFEHERKKWRAKERDICEIVFADSGFSIRDVRQHHEFFFVQAIWLTRERSSAGYLRRGGVRACIF